MILIAVARLRNTSSSSIHHLLRSLCWQPVRLLSDVCLCRSYAQTTGLGELEPERFVRSSGAVHMQQYCSEHIESRLLESPSQLSTSSHNRACIILGRLWASTVNVSYLASAPCGTLTCPHPLAAQLLRPSLCPYMFGKAVLQALPFNPASSMAGSGFGPSCQIVRAVPLLPSTVGCKSFGPKLRFC